MPYRDPRLPVKGTFAILEGSLPATRCKSKRVQLLNRYPMRFPYQIDQMAGSF